MLVYVAGLVFSERKLYEISIEIINGEIDYQKLFLEVSLTLNDYFDARSKRNFKDSDVVLFLLKASSSLKRKTLI